jgi:hypothetical protein
VPIEMELVGPERRVPPPYHPVDLGTPVRKLEFVEVGAGPVKAPRRNPKGAPAAEVDPEEAFAFTPAETPAAVNPGEPRWSLWGDAEI